MEMNLNTFRFEGEVMSHDFQFMVKSVKRYYWLSLKTVLLKVIILNSPIFTPHINDCHVIVLRFDKDDMVINFKEKKLLQDMFGKKIDQTKGPGNVLLAYLINMIADDDQVIDIEEKCPFIRGGEGEFRCTVGTILHIYGSRASTHPYIGRIPDELDKEGYMFPMTFGVVFATDMSSMFFEYNNVQHVILDYDAVKTDCRFRLGFAMHGGTHLVFTMNVDEFTAIDSFFMDKFGDLTGNKTQIAGCDVGRKSGEISDDTTLQERKKVKSKTTIRNNRSHLPISPLQKRKAQQISIKRSVNHSSNSANKKTPATQSATFSKSTKKKTAKYTPHFSREELREKMLEPIIVEKVINIKTVDLRAKYTNIVTVMNDTKYYEQMDQQISTKQKKRGTLPVSLLHKEHLLPVIKRMGVYPPVRQWGELDESEQDELLRLSAKFVHTKYKIGSPKLRKSVQSYYASLILSIEAKKAKNQRSDKGRQLRLAVEKSETKMRDLKIE